MALRFVTNYQLPIGTVNELIYGLMVNSVGGFKNPVGASVYGSIAGNAWYRAQLNLQDMKIGHYMHIPPRDVFFAQIFGSFLGIPVNYAVIRWVLDTKADYLTGKQVDPTHQWTGQEIASGLTTAVQYVLIVSTQRPSTHRNLQTTPLTPPTTQGPKRLFSEPIYHHLPLGFVLGAVAPLIIYTLHRLFPRARFDLVNCTIFFSCLAHFYGNISTGYLSSLIGGFVVAFWALRWRPEIYGRWNFILAAAFDAGFNFTMLLIFLFFGAGKVVLMPYWWGNEDASSERCFALGTN